MVNAMTARPRCCATIARALIWTTGCLLVGSLLASTAVGQQVVDVKGPGNAETTYMVQTPMPLGEDILLRPVGVEGPDGVRCALMLRGADVEDTVTILADGQPVRVEHTEAPTEAPRTLTVYVAPASFLAMAEADSASITIAGTEHALPRKMQEVLKTIYARITV